MEENNHNINVQHVIEALTAIHQPGATAEQIKVANAFLGEA